MQKATREQTKNHNTELVLKTIYNQGTMSRADIARLTYLTRPTVSAIVSRLMDERFVVEIGQGPSAGGKRPTLLQIDDNAYQLACVDLGSAEFRGTIINLKGDVVRRVSFAVDGQKGETAVQLVYELLDTLTGLAMAPLLGIGIGTPGLINPEEGVIQRAVNLDWTGLPIRQLLTERYRKPTYVVNDSHAAAFAEYTFGESRNTRHLLVIKIGQGVGAGIVLDGQPYYGDGFGAGEIGHVVVMEGGPVCTCGNRGCLETAVSKRAIIQKVQAAGRANPGSGLSAEITWEAIVQAYHNGDETVQTIVQEAGKYLGIALANLIGSLNIHHIVIVGGIIQLGEGFLVAARQEAQRRVLPSMAVTTQISYTTLDSDIVMLGCAAVILKQELGII